MIPYLIQGSNITLIVDGKPYTVANSHDNYAPLKEALKNEDWETAKSLSDIRKAYESYSEGNVKIEGDTFYWKGEELHNSLADKIIEMFSQGFTIEPMVKFMENLMTNPSFRAVKELYGFMEAGNLPITPDGHLLAYKKVKADYTDCYTGTIDNSIGQIVEMDRNKVNENPKETCSYGLHFCSLGYLRHFGGDHIMILKINPRDVVAIPEDYNNTKGRCCRYEVVDEVVDEVNAFGSKAVYSYDG